MISSTERFRMFSGGVLSSGLLSIRAQEGEQGGIPWWVWVLLILVIVVIAIWWYLSRRPEETAYGTGGRQLAAEPMAPPEPEVAPAPPDDLALIEGIGPKIASLLQEAGINTFAQLSTTDPARLESLLDEAGLQMADPSSWPEQAGLAAAGDWDALKSLQDNLKGGRRT
jgi:predicted flap endonuclease-1-like 5' DNA nuclease